MIQKEDSCYATYQDQKQLDGELRKEIQIAWPSLDQKQLDELITPQSDHPELTVGKIYGALLMFEHWKAYKNRQQDSKGFGGGEMKGGSRAESFASIVSVISQRMAQTKSQLSLRPGDIESVEHLNFVNSKVDEQPPMTKIVQRQDTLSSSVRSGKYLSVPSQQSRSHDIVSPSGSDNEDDDDFTIQSTSRTMPFTPQTAYQAK